MVQWFVGLGLVWSWFEPLLSLGLLLQQVELGVDVVFPQAAAGSGDLPATGSWFDFFLSRIFSPEKNLLGPEM